MTTIPLSVTDGFITKPRSDSASSRNDLFNTSWAPEVRPPKPLSLSPVAGPSTFPRTKRDLGFKLDSDGIPANDDGKGLTEFGKQPVGASTSTTQAPETRTSRTSSFFDTSSSDYPAPVPPPRPPTFSSGPPSPLSLSRSSSLRNRPPPLPLDFSTGIGTTTNTSSLSSSVGNTGRSHHQLPSSVQHVHPRTPPIDSEPLSPLHQSPSLPPIGDWTPPQPPSSEDVTLRLNPRSAFLLGEGRYATVFLGSYKKERKAKTKNPNPNPNPFLAYTKPRITRTPSSEDTVAGPGAGPGISDLPQGIADLEVNEKKDGYAGGSWRLCAAKRMAPDRQSQTMGLREAFFLNRLAGSGPASPMGTSSLLTAGSNGRDTNPNRNERARTRRAVSPLRERTTSAITTTNANATNRPSPQSGSGNGSVYVVKLIAVKEDSPARLVGFHVTPQGHGHPPGSGPGHGRSASDAITETKPSNTTHPNPLPSSSSRGLVRQRSSTMMNRSLDRDGHPTNDPAHHLTSLSSFPSLPSLAQAAQGDLPRNIHQHQHQYRHATTPAISRLVLILEHAPLGTMDRLLRTSPGLVGKALWQRWAIQTTEALQWVHGKGIVHADIKAGNLLLTADLDIRLSDFGSSLLIHPSHPPTDGVGLGTLPFSPPELVDPERSFSFPVDIFSLGATLYQCITGREPFRGCRTIEMMHHVRKGGLWVWEERERLQRIGQEREDGGVVPSPYPSAWRAGDNPAQATGAGVLPPLAGMGGIRRGGSLRVPNHNHSPGLGPTERPVLGRMSSTESLRASEDTGHVDSPPGVKLWGKWISKMNSTTNKRHSTGGGSGSSGTDPVSLLLAEKDDHTTPSHTIRTPTTLRVDTSASASASISPASIGPLHDSPGDSTSSSQVSPIIPVPHPDPSVNPESTTATVRRTPILAPSYNDGSPAMFFLGGDERVDDQVREVLRAMLQSREESRPTADQLRAKWEELGVEQ